MSWQKMQMTLMTPERIMVNRSVKKIVAEAENGFFCLLPRHVDYLAGLVPGILSYWDDNREYLLAVDEGTLVKCSDVVKISVRNAIPGDSLQELETQVREQFKQLDQREQQIRLALRKLEADFVRRFVELQKNKPNF